MREKADSDLVRRQNRLLLLEALRQHGALARVELGRHTGLSPASITSISSQLIADGILQEMSDGHPPQEAPHRRGRPLTQLGINPKSAHVVAVKVSIDGIELALADGRGTILSRRKSRTSTYDADPKAFGALVAAEIAALLAKPRISARRVARTIFLIDSGYQAPPLMLGSSAWTITSRPCTMPMPETWPAPCTSPP